MKCYLTFTVFCLLDAHQHTRIILLGNIDSKILVFVFQFSNNYFVLYYLHFIIILYTPNHALITGTIIIHDYYYCLTDTSEKKNHTDKITCFVNRFKNT